MNSGLIIDFAKKNEPTVKKVALFVCGTCIFVWGAIGAVAVGLVLASVLG